MYFSFLLLLPSKYSQYSCNKNISCIVFKVHEFDWTLYWAFWSNVLPVCHSAASLNLVKVNQLHIGKKLNMNLNIETVNLK